jgi:NAD:arginine ADP-ribosyltransferase
MDEDDRAAFSALIGEAALEAALSRQIADTGPDWFGLSLAERLAIHVYTTPMPWHDLINRDLWSDNPSAWVVHFASVLTRGLNKIPPYLGLTWRGVTLPRDVLDRYHVGSIVTWRGFTSSTPDIASAYGGNTLFAISSSTGRYIQPWSADAYVREVLFAAGTSFRVEYVGENRQGRLFLIELQEVLL